MAALARFRKIGKALFIFKAYDDSMDPKIIDIMFQMKTQLERRGISVTDDEGDKGCNMAIMFVTKDFLDHRFHDIGKIWGRFTTFNCSIIICDDKERKFVAFVKYSIFDSVRYCDEHDLAQEIQGYDVAVLDVDECIGTLVLASKPKFRTIIPGVSPATVDEIQKFAVDFADEAVLAFNPSRLDYNIIDPAFESDMKDIYSQVLSESNRIFQDGSFGDDLSFLVLAGCHCRCLDMTIITKLILNLDYLTRFKTDQGVAIMKKEYHNECKDPSSFQTAFIRANYGDGDDDKLAGDLTYHLGRSIKLRYLVIIEDFDFFDYQHGLLLLSSLTKLIGKGSLVVIATSSATQLLEKKMDLVMPVRGTTCCNDSWSMLKCYTITKSKLLPPMETEDAHVLSCHDTLDTKYTKMNDLAEYESLPKKHKATTF